MTEPPSSARVSLIKGDDRYTNVSKALQLIQDDIRLDKVRRILIKPNLTSTTRQLAATHADAIRALLDFLRERTSAQVIIGESPGFGNATDGFRNFGYLSLGEHYPVRFLDLNTDNSVKVQIFDHQLKPLWIRVAKTVVEADFRISICPPKTHDFVIITASLKNLVMGSIMRKENPLTRKIFAWGSKLKRSSSVPISGQTASWVGSILGSDKIKVHQGYPAMNLSLYKLARFIPLHLSIIDGFEAMEGDGPVDGAKVDLRVVLASTDFVACDSVAAKLMGFDIDQVGYLAYCHQRGLGQGDLSRIDIIGDSLENCARAFKPHSTYQAQLQWHIDEVEKYLD